MLNEMTSTILGKPRKIIHPGKYLCAMGAAMIAKKEAKQGRETGLNFKLVMKEIMSKDVVIEESVMDKVNAELHISRGGLKEAIHKTMRRCYPNPKDFK